jgi:starch phosphorylase
VARRLGRAKLYLLDTDLEENAPWDRQLSARLYGGDREMRVQQEIILGIGGVRVLARSGSTPSVFHLNEGHAGFVVLQRIREYIDDGKSFDEALEEVRRTTDLHDAHTRAGGARRVPVPYGGEAPRRRLGPSRRFAVALSSRSANTTTAAAPSST